MVRTTVGMCWFSQGKITYSISGVFQFSLSTAWIKIMQGEEKTRGFFYFFYSLDLVKVRGCHMHPNDPIGHIHPKIQLVTSIQMIQLATSIQMIQLVTSIHIIQLDTSIQKIQLVTSIQMILLPSGS